MFKTSMLSLLTLAVLVTGSSTLLAQEKTAAGLYNEGFALLKAKSYEEGLVLLEEALVKAEADGNEEVTKLAKKNGAVAAYNIGNAKRKAKALDEAMTYYSKAIALNPDYSSSYEGIARTLEAQGKKLEAVAQYVDAAQRATAEGKEDRAASRYKKARTMIGKMYVAKDYDNAIAAAQEFAKVNANDADVHYYLSKSLAEKGDTETAVTHISKAIELAGASSPDKYYYAHGSQLEKLGKSTEAIAAYKKITDDKYKKQADYRISELGGR
ncbi:MAG: tetratricopeptide repeat protein [Bacteroidota bacterium]